MSGKECCKHPEIMHCLKQVYFRRIFRIIIPDYRLKAYICTEVTHLNEYKHNHAKKNPDSNSSFGTFHLRLYTTI